MPLLSMPTKIAPSRTPSTLPLPPFIDVPPSTQAVIALNPQSLPFAGCAESSRPQSMIAASATVIEHTT